MKFQNSWPFVRYYQAGYDYGLVEGNKAGRASMLTERRYVLVAPSMSQAEFLVKLYQLNKNDVVTRPEGLTGLHNCVILFYDGGMWPVDTKDKMLEVIRSTVGSKGNVLIMLPEVQPVSLRPKRGNRK